MIVKFNNEEINVRKTIIKLKDGKIEKIGMGMVIIDKDYITIKDTPVIIKIINKNSIYSIDLEVY